MTDAERIALLDAQGRDLQVIPPHSSGIIRLDENSMYLIVLDRVQTIQITGHELFLELRKMGFPEDRIRIYEVSKERDLCP